jgi:hypothetical protein
MTSCNYSDNDDRNNTCNVSNPIEDLTWLKDKITELEQTSSYESGEIYISQANYNGNTVFIMGNCCAVCNTIVPIYNCEGESIGYIGDDTFDSTILEKDVIIWKPENFVCN